jgi:hypothetical protein
MTQDPDQDLYPDQDSDQDTFLDPDLDVDQDVDVYLNLDQDMELVPDQLTLILVAILISDSPRP